MNDIDLALIASVNKKDISGVIAALENEMIYLKKQNKLNLVYVLLADSRSRLKTIEAALEDDQELF